MPSSQVFVEKYTLIAEFYEYFVYFPFQDMIWKTKLARTERPHAQDLGFAVDVCIKSHPSCVPLQAALVFIFGEAL